MPQMDSSDNVQQSDRVNTQPDNFNRAELYNGANTQNQGDMSAGRQAGQNNGVNSDHIDFSQAGDIYGGKAQQTGLSTGDHNKNNSDAAQGNGADSQNNSNQNLDRFGRSTEAKPDIPKDGVINPNVQNDGSEMSTTDMMERKGRTGPITEGQPREAEKPTPSQNQEGVKQSDRVLTNSENGQTSEVSSYTADNNTLTNYQLNNNGDVASRTTTDLNSNNTDTVKFDQNGRAESRQVSENGGPAHDAPVDSKEQVNTIVGTDGKVKAIESSSPDGTSKISLDENGKPASTDRETYNADGSRDTRHENFNANGSPRNTESKHYDENGRMRTAETSDGVNNKKTTYDENRQVTQEDASHPSFNSSTKYTDEGKATVTESSNGHKSIDVERKDHSSVHSEYDPETRSSRTEEKFADGSRRTTSESSREKNTDVRDGVSGAWGKETVDKNTGKTTRQYGLPGMNQAESWSEQAI